jgi:hypothetical protein
MTDLTDSTMIVRDPAAIAGDVDGSTVILNVDRGTYCVLNRSGSRIFDLLAEPVSIEDLCYKLIQIYAVDDATCRKDVCDFIDRMLTRKLIKLA